MRRVPVVSALCLSLTITIVAGSGPASAATEDNAFAIRGIGGTTCERYVEVKNSDRALYFMYLGWLDGFLTASNKFLRETYDLAPWQSTELLAAAIEAHCKDNPESQVISVVNAMSDEMLATRLVENSAIVAGEVDGTQFRIYEAILRRMQDRLKEDGYYQGSANGTFDRQTRVAIERFQQERGIPITGLPDHLTLFHVLSEEPVETP